jgi:uncharacterized membrane protein
MITNIIMQQPLQQDLQLHSTNRIHAVDILRGIVMVIMVIDHVRDYWSPTPFRPEDLTQASTALFFTRWITHFCAPVFVFLSGVSAYLSIQNRKNNSNASIALLKRGLWFIVAEVVLITFFFQWGYQVIVLSVIWAIGWGMIFLSVFMKLPKWSQIAIVVLLIGGHNLFGGITPVTAENFLVAMLHNSPFIVPAGGTIILFSYALIPWVAVVGAGYVLGYWFTEAAKVRNRKLRILGIILLLIFIVLRTTNIYGDPSPWTTQENIFRTFLSWINVSKYPPSLLFISLTLGLVMISFPLLDRVSGRLEKLLTTYGKVPFFFFLLHLPLISSTSIVWAFLKFDVFTILAFSAQNLPVGYTPSLLRLYLVWVIVLLILYFPCRWYANYKSTHKNWITTYI